MRSEGFQVFVQALRHAPWKATRFFCPRRSPPPRQAGSGHNWRSDLAVMSLTLNRPESNEHDQQYAYQTHDFVAPLSKPQFRLLWSNRWD